MNRKELVQRWRNALGYGQKEMFYYPVKNETKIETIEYFDIYFQTLKYYNYYDIINNYPQYAENIDKKYSNISGETIAVFFNSDNIPLFKMNCKSKYRIKNIKTARNRQLKSLPRATLNHYTTIERKNQYFFANAKSFRKL